MAYVKNIIPKQLIFILIYEQMFVIIFMRIFLMVLSIDDGGSLFAGANRPVDDCPAPTGVERRQLIAPIPM